MLPRLFILAALALSATAQKPPAASASPTPSAGGFQFKEQYPNPGSVPTPKPEWMDLLKSANISNAPVLKGGSDGPKQSGDSDPYCDWTFTGCTRPDDIVACPKGDWGITYDDGPTEFSPKLYDFLDKSNQKATLFMIGGQVVRYPDLTMRAYKAGHELAMHTWSHSYLTTQTNEQIVAELKWTEQAIKEVTGVSPRFYRPPYGDIDDRVRDIAKALGFTAVIWNHDTDDWKVDEDPSFKETWIDGNVTEWAAEASTATEGGISLEHDLYQKTVDAAIRVLPVLQKAYNVKTVGACMKQPSYKEGNATVPTNATSSTAASSSAAATSSSSLSSSSSSELSPAGSNVSQTKGQEAQEKEGSAAAQVAVSSLGVMLVVAASYVLA
ncbi:uncharacterized protein BYT42DRAFT_576889 [Radiomyces spectabilis]|uniref:uncharacterized protein n=1 Tax=Radiomyces spectabilis TaxID=64574 RepID=UPI0022200672|nr:uncharacterized protein BYT42DRAFT_576889 [Radiomyces spectabilis]KAI8374591.1 hypothetical protein BYT42DRAFT_576889 [Radiomyces spectabilis]